jgi:hypothetical protein
MVCRILHQDYFKEVGLTQNWETTTLQSLPTLDPLQLIV